MLVPNPNVELLLYHQENHQRTTSGKPSRTILVKPTQLNIVSLGSFQPPDSMYTVCISAPQHALEEC
jgi:hypothetical protein